MSRILIFAAMVLAVSLGAQAQTVIDITNQAGTATCSYPTGPVTSSATPGHLKAQLTGTPTGTGCSSGSSGGTPSANFTFTTNNLTATFTDTSTDAGGTINAWSWTFGDSGTATTKNPSHIYASAGTYSVTLTVTDSVNSQQSNITKSVTVNTGTGGSCPVIAGDGTQGVNSFSRWTGTQSVFYFGSGQGTGNQSADVTSYNSSWAISPAVWPQSYGRQPVFPLPSTNYMAQQFSVPAGYFAGAPTNIYGEYLVGSSQNDALVSMTISTKCGDFSNPQTSGSSVVSGCYIKNAQTGGFLMWSKSFGCTLTDGQTYYLNIINADITNVTPTGGTAASSMTSNCLGGSCRVPLSNQGTFNSYHP